MFLSRPAFTRTSLALRNCSFTRSFSFLQSPKHSFFLSNLPSNYPLKSTANGFQLKTQSHFLSTIYWHENNQTTLLTNPFQALEEKANSKWDDTEAQTELLQAYNAAGRYDLVVHRFDKIYPSCQPPVTRTMIYELIKAAVKTDSLEKIPRVPLNFFFLPSSVFVLEQGTKDNPLVLSVHTSKSEYLFRILTTLAIFAVIYFWLYYYRKGSINASPVHKQATETSTTFNDVKGIDEVRLQFEEIVDYLKEPGKYTSIGAKIPKGILLVGSPGTGKTLLARAVAGEAGVPFYFISASELDEIFVGVGPKRIRALFEEAKKNAPCIVFIDELDTIGKRDKKMSYTGSLNQLLSDLDGFVKNEGVVVIAATNVPEEIDPALLRPGRFDKTVKIPLPDISGRKDILDLYFSKVKIDPTIPAETYARVTMGFAGADLENLVNIAALKAVTRGRKLIVDQDLQDALDDIRLGLPSSAKPTPRDIKVAAYHEAGHTLVSLFSSNHRPLNKVSIIQRGPTVGFTDFAGREIGMYAYNEILTEIAVLMGGKAAEEIIFGENGIHVGHSNDLSKATQLASALVTQWGFSERLGLAVYKESSDLTQRMIEEEIKRISDTQYEYAKKLLESKKDLIHKLADALIERETLTVAEVQQIIRS